MNIIKDMNIIKGKLREAQKVLIYGSEGIGKSTLAAQFPNPVFIDTEGSTSGMDVSRFDRPSSFTMLMQQVRYVLSNTGLCSTLVIDTADWAEMLCISEFCAKKQISGIEDIGYGKGYVYVAEDFGKLLNLLEEVKSKGINVVVTAHAQMRKFEQPDELGAYDRWELKLQKKTAPLLKEWADMVLFCNYKTYVVNVDGQGAQKGKNKAQGGKRVIYTTHHNCWDAKNRHGLPDELPMEYGAFAHCIPDMMAENGDITKPQENVTRPQENVAKPQENVAKPQENVIKPQESVAPSGSLGGTGVHDKPAEAEKKPEEGTAGIPKELSDLMKTSPFKVTVADIQDAVEARGYYPAGTPIANYDKGFVDGCLIAAWDKVLGMIRERKLEKDEFIEINTDNPNGVPDSIPFNN